MEFKHSSSQRPPLVFTQGTPTNKNTSTSTPIKLSPEDIEIEELQKAFQLALDMEKELNEVEERWLALKEASKYKLQSINTNLNNNYYSIQSELQILYNKENEKINNSTFEKQIIKANVENEYSEIITKRSDGINSITHRINKLNDSKKKGFCEKITNYIISSIKAIFTNEISKDENIKQKKKKN